MRCQELHAATGMVRQQAFRGRAATTQVSATGDATRCSCSCGLGRPFYRRRVVVASFDDESSTDVALESGIRHHLVRDTFVLS